MSVAITAIEDIAERFDAVLIDQFGVLHDGRAAFAPARAAMERLARRGVPVVALSNSGKRATPNLARLDRLGFPACWFRKVVTSGELAHARIGEMLADGRLSPGDGITILSRDDDDSVIGGYDLRRVEPGPEARLVLIAGAEPEHRKRETYRITLAPLAAKGVPALCVNPDLMIYANGMHGFGPGCIAEDYRAMGGGVTLLGKPGEEMFAAGLAALGNPLPARVLMIGDSPAHDIAGAKAAGCLSLLTCGGVQGGTAGSEPDFTIPALC